jgi:hypothetical protein
MVSFQAQADLTKETASSKSKFAVPIIYINPSETVTDADSKAKLENVLSLFEDHNINVTLLPAYQVLKYYPLTTQYLTSKARTQEVGLCTGTWNFTFHQELAKKYGFDGYGDNIPYVLDPPKLRQAIYGEYISLFNSTFGFMPSVAGGWFTSAWETSYLLNATSIKAITTSLHRIEGDSATVPSPQYPHYPTLFSLSNWADEQNKMDVVVVQSAYMDELRSWYLGRYYGYTTETLNVDYWKKLTDYALDNLTEWNDFGFLSVCQDFDYINGWITQYSELINYTKAKTDVTWVKLGEFADWFKLNYDGSPSFRAVFNDVAGDYDLTGNAGGAGWGYYGKLVEYVEPMNYHVELFIREPWDSEYFLVSDQTAGAKSVVIPFFNRTNEADGYGIYCTPWKMLVKIANEDTKALSFNVTTHQSKHYWNETVAPGSSRVFDVAPYCGCQYVLNVSCVNPNTFDLNNGKFKVYFRVVEGGYVGINTLEVYRINGYEQLYSEGGRSFGCIKDYASLFCRFDNSLGSGYAGIEGCIPQSFVWGIYNGTDETELRLVPQNVATSIQFFDGAFIVDSANEYFVERWALSPDGVITNIQTKSEALKGNTQVSFGIHDGGNGGQVDYYMAYRENGRWITSEYGDQSTTTIGFISNGTLCDPEYYHSDENATSLLSTLLFNSTDANVNALECGSGGTRWGSYREFLRYNLTCNGTETLNSFIGLIPVAGTIGDKNVAENYYQRALIVFNYPKTIHPTILPIIYVCLIFAVIVLCAVSIYKIFFSTRSKKQSLVNLENRSLK